MSRTGFVLGGVVYNLKVDARHAVTMAELLAEIEVARRTHALSEVRSGIRSPFGDVYCEGISYRHTSVLPEGRHRWLEEACRAKEATWAISMDADTWIRAGHAREFLDGLPRAPSNDLALVGALVPCRDNRVNAWSMPGKRIAAEDVVARFRVQAIGLAIVAYHLPWYRRNLDRGAFAIMMHEDGAFIGEDVWHCNWIEKHRGAVLALGHIPTVHGAQS